MVSRIGYLFDEFFDDFICLLQETEFEIRCRNPDTRQNSANTIHGIVVYFDVYFSEGRDGKMVLTNSPHGELTHWQQSLCLFEVNYFNIIIYDILQI